ncbi:MAG TPA: porphobilinogen synthase [Nitrososphaera sp.]|jgi:porphobilinogen synthase|nr:porphobilinogen synthase [Nitrososphaera sp.]
MNKININNSNTNSFPLVRLRRLRTTPAVRDLLQETRLSTKDLIAPVFVQEGLNKSHQISSMPDIQRTPLSKLVSEIDKIMELGISAIILFGLPLHKDANGGSASDCRGIVQKSIEMLRKHFGTKLAIITDVCLCQYTTHGHCGLVKDNNIDNDKTIEMLARVAVSHAGAGADIVAPSAMMDGQVQAIRAGLDGAGFTDVAIMGYSAKQASPLYAPFRDAAHSAPEFGDRRTYQMPFSNGREAMREVETDIKEGVDIVMIKPAIPYLDLVYSVRQNTHLPICAYSVSGEYALIKAAAMNGWIDENAVMTEFLTSIKRAGSDMIITYQAKKMAELLNK